MQTKQSNITYAYHFMSEAILLFLVCLPVMYYHFKLVPYGSFLVIASGICMIYLIFTKISNSYMWYIISAPFFIVIFYASDYPLFMGIVFSVALAWRFINIRNETVLNREMGYIKITLVLATGLMLLINEYQIILYAFLQFLFLIVGYISSHLTVIQKEERKRFDNKLWLYIGFMLSMGSVLIFLLFDPGRNLFLKIGEGLSYAAAVAASKVAFVFQFLDFNKVQLPGSETPMEQQQKQLNELQQGSNTSLIEEIMPYIYWTISLTIAAIIIILAIRFFNKKFRIADQADVSDAIVYGNLDDKQRDNRSFISKIVAAQRKPSHPVRKLVYNFEKKALKNGYGRSPFETVEDWLARLGIDNYLTVYQKVRYGEKDVSDQEVNTLREQLLQVEERLEK
ncbi:hypothetical protein [Virgibacillus oceani]|uniref:DUF4129 domain-containing protein n=1 Tax=Virgibacillus oceani TaxID=1479511 RepID=A0A917LY99_9BACI|nr:hypothetical protein [Virgibacillus oceani]GGG66724.1 hypothetical protein GCM10011398_07960 [Virgibacillus oceani]